MPLVQGVNHIGCCPDQGCLSEVVVIHEWEVHDERLPRNVLTFIAGPGLGSRESRPSRPPHHMIGGTAGCKVCG